MKYLKTVRYAFEELEVEGVNPWVYATGTPEVRRDASKNRYAFKNDNYKYTRIAGSQRC